jgi:hypothetical protein
MHRPLTADERELLCSAFKRFAAASANVDAIQSASEQYRSELDRAGIVYTSLGFRVRLDDVVEVHAPPRVPR